MREWEWDYRNENETIGMREWEWDYRNERMGL